MPGSISAEVIFVTAMMVLILIVSFATVYFFFKTYKKEMKDKQEAKEKARSKVSAVKEDAS